MFENWIQNNYSYIDSEIKTKQKAYLIAYDLSNFEAVIDQYYRDDIQLFIGDMENKISQINFDHYTLTLTTSIMTLVKNISNSHINNNNISLKKVKYKDIETYTKVINEIMHDVPASITYDQYETHRLIESGFNDLYLIQKEKEVVGILEVSFEEDIPEITNIGILSKNQGQGIGKVSLNLIENILSKDYDQLTINVAKENEVAYRLYTDFGFKFYQDKIKYYLIDKR